MHLNDESGTQSASDMLLADSLFESRVIFLYFKTSKAKAEAANILKNTLYRQDEDALSIYEIKELSSLSLPEPSREGEGEPYSETDKSIIQETKQFYHRFDFIMLQCGVPLGRDPSRDFIRIDRSSGITAREALKFENNLKDFKLNRGFSFDLAIRQYEQGRKEFMIIYLGRYG